MSPKCLASRLIILLGLLLGTAACSQTVSVPHGSLSPTVAQPSSTPPPTSALTVTPPPLGSVPQNCSPGAVPHTVFSQLGPVVGQAPIWAAGFDGPHAVLRIPTSYDTYTQYGWTWKLVWEIGPHFSQKVTLHGVNLRTGVPLWFQFNGPETPAPVLDPQQPTHPAAAAGGDYAEFGSYLYIPTADCYALDATWPGGQWRILFAAGR
jgi:hypothetical protein